MLLLLLAAFADEPDPDELDMSGFDLSGLLGGMLGGTAATGLGAAGVPFDLSSLLGAPTAGKPAEGSPPLDLSSLLGPALGGGAPQKPASPDTTPAGPSVTWSAGPEAYVSSNTGGAMPIERTVPVLLPGLHATWLGARPASPAVDAWEPLALACLRAGAEAPRRIAVDLTLGATFVIDVRVREGVEREALTDCLAATLPTLGPTPEATVRLTLAPEPAATESSSGIVIHRR